MNHSQRIQTAIRRDLETKRTLGREERNPGTGFSSSQETAENGERGAERSTECWQESLADTLEGGRKPRIPRSDLSSGMAENPTKGEEEGEKYPKTARSLEPAEGNPGEI